MWWTEFRFQSRNPSQFESAGTIRLHTDDENIRKPAWLVAAKMLALVAMFVVGFAVIMPSVPLPSWSAAILTGGALLTYVGVAFLSGRSRTPTTWAGWGAPWTTDTNTTMTSTEYSGCCTARWGRDGLCRRRSSNSSRCAASLWKMTVRQIQQVVWLRRKIARERSSKRSKRDCSGDAASSPTRASNRSILLSI